MQGRLVYDTASRSYTYVSDQGVQFLGPLANARATLEAMGMRSKHAREAVVQAFFGRGLSIDLGLICRTQ